MAIDQGVRSKKETKADVQSVIELAHKQGLKIVDLKFIDLIGTWQHFSIPVQELSKDLFSEGIGFDGSSIRGFQHIHESDMLLIPDPSTAIVDPVLRVPTLSINCDVIDPITREPYSRDPRYVGKKAEAFLSSTGIADTSFWGPECEFYIFNSMRFDQNQFSGMYEIDSVEGVWNSGKNSEPNQAYRPRYKEGYFPVPPTDKLQDLRSQIVLKLIEAGVDVEVHHHEVGTAGQTEIDMRFDTLVNMADKVMMYKYVVKNVCAQNGFVATFMPKPLFMDNGSGMHTHQSLWKNGAPLFYDKPKAKRLEFRTPDPSCNPYLSFAACLMAGLDGVINKIEPPKPIDEDLYELEPELKRQVKSTPGSLLEVLDALEMDNECLLRGGVFTTDLIETWIDYKRVKEYDQVALRPHPWEFYLYHDI